MCKSVDKKYWDVVSPSNFASMVSLMPTSSSRSQLTSHAGPSLLKVSVALLSVQNTVQQTKSKSSLKSETGNSESEKKSSDKSIRDVF